MLFDSHKDVVSGKNFGFWQYFCFLVEKLDPKWTKTINFGYVLFPLKHLILKDLHFNQHFLTYLWSKFQETRVIFTEEGPETPQKGPFHGYCIAMKTFENL